MTRLMLLIVLSLALGPQATPAWSQDAQAEFFATHGRYQLQPGDVFEVRYRYSPEFNEVVTVQPDGFVMLQIAGEVKVDGLTVEGVRLEITRRSEVRLADPEVAIALREFERPSFIVSGEVTRPGRFDLRGTVNALEAIALAGGFTSASKHSQVLLVRRLDADRASVQPLDLKRLERQPGQADEWRLRPGDLLIVPKNTLSKVERIVRWTSLGLFWNPAQR